MPPVASLMPRSRYSKNDRKPAGAKRASRRWLDRKFHDASPLTGSARPLDRRCDRQTFHAALFDPLRDQPEAFTSSVSSRSQAAAASRPLGVHTVWRTTVKLPSSMRAPGSVDANLSRAGFSPAITSSFSRTKCCSAALEPAICTNCAFRMVRPRYRSYALLAGRHDAHAGAIDFTDAADRRFRRHEIRRFDLGQRRREIEDLGAFRLVAEHRDVPRVVRQRIRQRAGRLVRNDLQRHIEPARELARKLDRHSALLAVRARGREQSILKVDSRAQLAGGRELGFCGVWKRWQAYVAHRRAGGAKRNPPDCCALLRTGPGCAGLGAPLPPLSGAATRVAVGSPRSPPCAARQRRQPAELTHRSFPIRRDLLGKALPLVTVVWFDSPRPKPRRRLRCSGASTGRQGRTQPGARRGAAWSCDPCSAVLLRRS